MKKLEDYPDAEVQNDEGLRIRVIEATHEPTHIERGPVLRLIFEAKDIFLGGLNGLHEHPVGSLELGSAFAVTGLAAAAVLPRHRHAH